MGNISQDSLVKGIRKSISFTVFNNTMSMNEGTMNGNASGETEDYTLLEELSDDPEALPVILNDDQGNELQAVLLSDPELRRTTLALSAVTLSDGTEGFLVNQQSTPDEEEKEQETNTATRSIIIRNSSNSDSKTAELDVSPLVVSQPWSSEPAKETDDSIRTQIQIVDGRAVMIPREKENISRIKLTNQSRPKFMCPTKGCGKVYTTPHHLKVHERMHTGLRPYKCEYPGCTKEFCTGYSLKTHQRTHTGEKPYKCITDGCEKSFKTSGDLLKHCRIHTGEKPFICPVEGCYRAFTTGNILKVHMRTHTGERPYICELCKKSFASATNYKNHMRIHSREKPYVCMVDNCRRSFTEYSSLYKHRLVHTPDKPFECNWCKRRYRHHSTFMMHRRTVHGLLGNDDQVVDKRVEDGASGVEEADDSGTQILFVGDAKQLAALQQMNVDGDFENSPMDTPLEGLSIKIEGMEFSWN